MSLTVNLELKKANMKSVSISRNTSQTSAVAVKRFEEISGVIGLFSLFATAVVMLSLQWIH